MIASGKKTPDRLAVTVKGALLPIMIFALVAAPVCWAAAFVFVDRVEWSNTLIGLGCLPIVIAVCAYLFVLVNTVKRAN